MMNKKTQINLEQYKQEIKNLAKLNKTSADISKYLNDKYNISTNNRQLANFMSRHNILFKTKTNVAKKDKVPPEHNEKLKRIVSHLVKYKNTFAGLLNEEEWIDNNLNTITKKVKKETQNENIKIIKTIFQEDIILTVISI